MVKEYKPFTEDTLDDALSVVKERFPPEALRVAKKVIANPMRAYCTDAGTIGYRDGRPVAFQAAMLRRLYIGQEVLWGTVGGLTCKVKKGCPLSVLLETIDRAAQPLNNGRISFGNSCRKETADIDQCGGAASGPISCSRFLWRAVRPIECLLYFIRRKLLKGSVPNWNQFSTLSSVNYCEKIGNHDIRRLYNGWQSRIDEFWVTCLERNEGLISSRSSSEMDWMFGERITKGEAVLLAAEQDDVIIGYIIVGAEPHARRWLIMDWIAADNDITILEGLVRGACRFLRRHTPAMILEAHGFPAWVQPILEKHLPFKRQMGFNFFNWGAYDGETRRLISSIINSDKSWFFGPYDGDLCM